MITGAAGGLGAALARRFAAEGARIGLLDRDRAGAEALADELEGAGHAALAAPCDVTAHDSCAQALAAVRDRLGAVDVLVNNAGISHRSAFVDTDVAVLERVMAVNYLGAMYCTKLALSDLVARHGVVVAISSVAGFAPLDGRTGYCASKHALHGFFDTLRSELRGTGVDVLLVCPSFIATGIGAAAMGADGGQSPRRRATVGAVATPDAVAASVVRAAARGDRLLLPSGTARAARLLTRLAPRLYARLMSRAVRTEIAR